MKPYPKWLILFIFTAPALSACSGLNKRPKTPERVVPIEINISGDSRDVGFINLDYYRLKVLDALEDFQGVDLQLTEPDETPEVILDIKIENFVLWPRDERTSRRVLARNVVVGTDAAGKPIYQTVRASVDIVQVQRRSNARFVTRLNFKGTPPKTFERTFAPNFNYQKVFVDNIQGDPRAVDPSLYFSRGTEIEPREDEFLLALSQQEMLRRLSNEIRSYYD